MLRRGDYLRFLYRKGRWLTLPLALVDHEGEDYPVFRVAPTIGR